ncbi:hypothetical protein RIF29_40365 [Crotalaria pallida]|uniref:Uncharacterized protein n=1 Tax=Crotalaria pallida TaxID=3830 RepID=A0AAN9HQK4_CROPI
MAEEQEPKLLEASPHPPPPAEASPPPRPTLDPSRSLSLSLLKALIKDLAAVYNAECLSHCQHLLQLQSNSDQISF